MDRSISERSLSDRNTDVACSPSSTSDIADQIQISFGESYLQQTDELSKF